MLLAEIADEGSVTAAACKLGSSQPAVSKQLRRLEESLGVTLLERALRRPHFQSSTAHDHGLEVGHLLQH